MELQTQDISYTSETSLMDRLKDQIDNMTDQCTLFICAGHAMLIYHKDLGKYVMGIHEDITAPEFKERVSSSIGNFPSYTWELGCKLVAYAKSINKKAKLVLLINDWQYIETDEEREDSKPNRFRKEFYDSFDHLPNSYQKILDDHGLSFKDDLYWHKPNEFYMREVGLRDRFARHVKKLYRDGVLINYHCEQQRNGEIYFSHPSLVPKPIPILQNKQAGCAGEITQMIQDICKSQGDDQPDENTHMFNFLPIQCERPVNNGTIMSFELYNREANVTNIYLEGNSINNNDDFYKVDEGVKLFHYTRQPI